MEDIISVYEYNGVRWALRGKHSFDELGFIPTFLSYDDERPSAEQIDANYQHGGGWRPNNKFKFDRDTHTLQYPGDPELKSFAVGIMPNETLLMFPYSILLIFNRKEKTYEVARVD